MSQKKIPADSYYGKMQQKINKKVVNSSIQSARVLRTRGKSFNGEEK
jgi:hypothetical protein